jgi:hypothetical protein
MIASTFESNVAEEQHPLKIFRTFRLPKRRTPVVQSPGLYGSVPQLGDSFNPGGRVSGDGLSRRCRSRNFRSKTKFYMGRGHNGPTCLGCLPTIQSRLPLWGLVSSWRRPWHWGFEPAPFPACTHLLLPISKQKTQPTPGAAGAKYPASSASANGGPLASRI